VNSRDTTKIYLGADLFHPQRDDTRVSHLSTSSADNSRSFHKDQLAAFLRDELKLELSAEKTLITHARIRAARYLGYEIIAQHSDHKITRGRGSINGSIALRVPPDVIKAKCVPYLQHGKPEARTAMHNLDDYDIVATCGAKYRSIVQYCLLATDVWRLARLCWTAETSMLKTLAAK
jgi:hypothetical protein